MASRGIEELSDEQRREIGAWIKANSAELPPAVQAFLALHQSYLSAESNVRKAFDAALRDLRRALHITPSSEKRRRSGSPLANIPPVERDAEGPREKIERQIARGNKLGKWHRELRKRHKKQVKRLEEKLAKMSTEKADDSSTKSVVEPERLEDIELTEEESAEGVLAGQIFVEHLLKGSGADPAMKSVNETLMPAGAVLETTEQESVPAEVPADLAEARVVKTLSEQRVRYDFTVEITRIEIDVEKKVLVDESWRAPCYQRVDG